MKPIFQVLRPNQWIKNLALFAAIIFSGQLFNLQLFWRVSAGFLVFSSLSSASYVFNDLIDAPLDRRHRKKRHRPIAAGRLSPTRASELIFLLSLLGIVAAFSLSLSFFLVAILFLLLHFFYTLYLKKYALLDILSIASSFLLRVFAGEILSGFHIPVWLLFSVVFLSLFIASCKRRSELVLEGGKARPALLHYRRQLLDFYNSTFATGTIITYAIFTFQTQPPEFNPLVTQFLLFTFPAALGRKWLMVTTLPFVIVGIMRYAQLIYEKDSGEAPERLITSDKPLIATIVAWGVSVILFKYIL